MANNHYLLDENILQRIVENHNAAEQSKAKSKEKHLATEKKRNENLNTALWKFMYAPNTMTVLDIKALVTASQLGEE